MARCKPILACLFALFTLLCSTLAAAAPDALSTNDFVVKEIQAAAIVVDNNRIIPPATIAILTTPYLNRPITYIDLEKLRNELTIWLIENGYINSGVIIPDQEVQDGTVHLRVVEGRVSSIKIDGNRYFNSSYLSDRIERSCEQPFRIGDLQERFQLFYQDQRIISINAELSAGLKPGEGNLNVRVAEASPWLATLYATNDNPPDIGSYYGSVTLGHRNLTGHGDSIEALFGGSEGMYEYGGRYSLPLSAADNLLDLYFRHSDTKVISDEFEPLDIESDSDTFGIRLSHPVVRSTRRELRPALSVEYRESQNYLLGNGFSFSSFEDDGKSSYSVARPGIDWIERRKGTVLVASALFSRGLTREKFSAGFGRILWMQQTGILGSKIHLKGEIQYAFTDLPPMEKYALGGMYSVRGYCKNLLIADNGTNASLEWWLPAFHDPAGKELLSFGPFVDYGRSWEKSDDGQTDQELASAGVGARLNWKGLAVDLFYGHGFHRSGFQNTSAFYNNGFNFAVTWNAL